MNTQDDTLMTLNSLPHGGWEGEYILSLSLEREIEILSPITPTESHDQDIHSQACGDTQAPIPDGWLPAPPPVPCFMSPEEERWLLAMAHQEHRAVRLVAIVPSVDVALPSCVTLGATNKQAFGRPGLWSGDG